MLRTRSKKNHIPKLQLYDVLQKRNGKTVAVDLSRYILSIGYYDHKVRGGCMYIISICFLNIN